MSRCFSITILFTGGVADKGKARTEGSALGLSFYFLPAGQSPASHRAA